MKVTIQQILDMPPETIKKLSVSDLKKVVQALGNEANLRIQALKNAPNGQKSPAYQKAMKRGKPYGELSDERTQLIQEYNRLTDFLNMTSSTVSGWGKMQEDLGMYTQDMGTEQLDGFYSLFARFLELHPDLVAGELSLVRQAAYKYYQENQDLDNDRMLESFEDILDQFWAGSFEDVEDDFGY